MRRLILATIAGVALSGAASASPIVGITYTLPFIGTWQGYDTNDTSLTFAGDGYVGMYSGSFGALFGVEGTENSRTNVQVNIGALAGQNVLVAQFTVRLFDGFPGPQAISVTASAGTGALGYEWEAPAVNLGSIAASVVDGANTIDVTPLVQAAVAANVTWLNLHFRGTGGEDLWTYAGDGLDVDRAEARLVVRFDTVGVPEPMSLALFGLGLAGLGVVARRRA